MKAIKKTYKASSGSVILNCLYFFLFLFFSMPRCSTHTQKKYQSTGVLHILKRKTNATTMFLNSWKIIIFSQIAFVNVCLMADIKTVSYSDKYCMINPMPFFFFLLFFFFSLTSLFKIISAHMRRANQKVGRKRENPEKTT